MINPEAKMSPVVRAASVFVGVGVFLSLPLLSSAKADIGAFPPDFRTEDVKAGDAVIHVRVGGHGPAIVMLHGFGDGGDMWAPLAAEMAKDHTVVVPDLRGMGLSSHPAGGYDKKTQANDVAAVLDKLGIRRADLVTHDIGNMVGYAFAAQFPDRVTRWVAMDAPLPGIGNWDKIVLSPLLWHFNFRGPDVEGKPAVIPDKQIHDLKLITGAGMEVECTCNNFPKGSQVRVVTGPLNGLTGELVSTSGKKRVMIRIDHLDSVILVTVSPNILEPVRLT